MHQDLFTRYCYQSIEAGRYHNCELPMLAMCLVLSFSLFSHKYLPSLLLVNLLYQNPKHEQFPINSYGPLAFAHYASCTHQSDRVNKDQLVDFLSCKSSRC